MNRWKESISTILLLLGFGPRIALKENVEYSPAQMTHGKTIKYPDEFLYNYKILTTSPCADCRRKRNGSNWINHETRNGLESVCAQEFECVPSCLRKDRQNKKESLEPAYGGPFKVLERKKKYFGVEVEGNSLSELCFYRQNKTRIHHSTWNISSSNFKNN